VYKTNPSPPPATIEDYRTAASPVCSVTDGTGCSGWYADLPGEGERVNLDMRLALGSLTVISNVTNIGVCDSGGNSWTNVFDAATGQAVIGADGVVSRYMAGAVSVGVSFIRGRSGRILAIITKSDGSQEVSVVPTQQAPPQGRRSGWRDLLEK
jgi:Tfp pilus tip-associated adhesin PilY1